MVSFTLSTITLGFAALSTALPSSKHHLSKNEVQFSLIAEGYPTLSLNARNSGILGNLDLVFERTSVYPGTPAYINNTLLDFDVGNPSLPGPYSANYQNVGDNYGTIVPVTAIYGESEGTPGFSIGTDNTLQFKMTAALQHFFACNGTYNGEELLGLYVGVFKANGENPDGCVQAKLVANKAIE